MSGAAIEISDVKCTDLIYIRTLPVVHVQLFRTVYSIFVNCFRDLRIYKKKKPKQLRVDVGVSETLTKHCLITYNV